jgi:hypothetical protein
MEIVTLPAGKSNAAERCLLAIAAKDPPTATRD